MLENEPMKLTTKNLYSYCDNNPVSKTDSNGESALAAVALSMAKEASISVGLYILSSAITKEKITGKGIAYAAITGAASGIVDCFKKYKMLVSVTVDCVSSALTCGFETENIGYAIFSAMAAGALSLGSMPGMMELLKEDNYMPAVEKFLFEFYVETANNVLMNYVIPEDSGNDEESIAASAGNYSGIVYKRIGGEYFAFA